MAQGVALIITLSKVYCATCDVYCRCLLKRMIRNAVREIRSHSYQEHMDRQMELAKLRQHQNANEQHCVQEEDEFEDDDMSIDL